MADGQVTQGSQVVKPNVRKVRRIGENAIGGFAGPAPVAVRTEEAVVISSHKLNCDRCSAGATADAFTLFEELEVAHRLLCHFSGSRIPNGYLASPIPCGLHRYAESEMQGSKFKANRAIMMDIATVQKKLIEHPGQLTRAAVELAKDWRMNKYLRKLDVRPCTAQSSCFLPQGHRCAARKQFWLLRVQAVMIVADATDSLQITGNGDVLSPHDGIIGECSCRADQHADPSDLMQVFTNIQCPPSCETMWRGAQQLGPGEPMPAQLLGP